MSDTTSGAGATGDNSAFFNEGRTSAGGTAGSTGGSTGSGGSGGKSSGVSKAADTIVSQLKDQVSSLRSTAGDRARTYAVDGKRQATDLLGKLADVIQDASSSVETRLGSQYSGFGTRAVDQVNSLARTLDEREIDDLLDDARAFVRRSPAVALGAAALVGFAVARVVRAGVEDLTHANSGGTGATGATGAMSTTTTTTTTTTGDATMGSAGLGAGATGGLGATSGGFGEQGVGTAGTMGGTTGGAGSGNGIGSSAPKY